MDPVFFDLLLTLVAVACVTALCVLGVVVLPWSDTEVDDAWGAWGAAGRAVVGGGMGGQLVGVAHAAVPRAPRSARRRRGGVLQGIRRDEVQRASR